MRSCLVELTVNGRQFERRVEPRISLADFLRDELQLTGTKLGCEQLAYAYRADAVVLRYFTVYGPRQRPDMFFRRVCEALLAGATFEIYGTGEQSRQ